MPGLVGAGLVALVAFVGWQAHNQRAPEPLRLFGDRNFALASVGMTAMGFALTGFGLPLMLYAQNVLGYTALQSALILLPMAIVMIALAPVVGRLIGKVSPRYLAACRFACTLVALLWTGTSEPAPQRLGSRGAQRRLGIGSSFVAAPISTTAIRNLQPDLAGAGSARSALSGRPERSSAAPLSRRPCR